MRIKKIEVTNLFGMFNHDIPFKLEEHITIIHGPNGFGKTIILTMLNAFFTSKYQRIRDVPFNEFIITFHDKSKLSLKKNVLKNNKNRNFEEESSELIFEYRKSKQKKPLIYKVTSLKPSQISFPLRILDEEIRGLDRIGPKTWYYNPTNEKLSLDNVLERFGDRLPIPSSSKAKEPLWIRNIKESIEIHFIETQRLFSFSRPRHVRYEKSMFPAVKGYSEELVNAIQEKLAEYASLSQSLDRTFPTRLVKETPDTKLTLKKLRNKLSELEGKRSRLMIAGLLDKEKEIDLTDLQNINENNINVLSVYIEDVKEKLGVFDELTNKIDLLVKVINKRFLNKQMSIGKKEGFIFINSKGKILSCENLSSGEQHELVLLYELLFKVNPNSLILIDEPELSLHIIWQQQFLKDLQEITELGKFDVLIATHSPQIIHDRWDLTVELVGPKI